MKYRCDICGKMSQINSNFEYGVLTEVQKFCGDCSLRLLREIDKLREEGSSK